MNFCGVKTLNKCDETTTTKKVQYNVFFYEIYAIIKVIYNIYLFATESFIKMNEIFYDKHHTK